MHPRCDIDKVRERGETWAVDSELLAPIGDVLDASTAEPCRHIDEVGELIARYWESVERRQDQLARRTDRLEGWISALETRVSSIEADRKPRRPRRRR